MPETWVGPAETGRVGIGLRRDRAAAPQTVSGPSGRLLNRGDKPLGQVEWGKDEVHQQSRPDGKPTGGCACQDFSKSHALLASARRHTLAAPRIPARSVGKLANNHLRSAIRDSLRIRQCNPNRKNKKQSQEVLHWDFE
jgi:hypothetical protein